MLGNQTGRGVLYFMHVNHSLIRGRSIAAKRQDVTVQLFWKVLASLSQEEQSGFVRFAWGRSRLPPKHAWFKDMQVRACDSLCLCVCVPRPSAITHIHVHDIHPSLSISPSFL